MFGQGGGGRGSKSISSRKTAKEKDDEDDFHSSADLAELKSVYSDRLRYVNKLLTTLLIANTAYMLHSIKLHVHSIDSAMWLYGQ